MGNKNIFYSPLLDIVNKNRKEAANARSKKNRIAANKKPRRDQLVYLLFKQFYQLFYTDSLSDSFIRSQFKLNHININQPIIDCYRNILLIKRKTKK